MKVHELKLNRIKSARRVGRGIAAGQGKTAGRGTKGQKSRTGYTKRPGFEGGQNPLMQRLPKLPGFNSRKKRDIVVYTGQLDALAGKTVDAAALAEAGLIPNPYVKVKVITKGEVSKKITLKVQSVSASALALVQEAGGSFEAVEVMARPASASADSKDRRKSAKQTKSKK